MIDNNEFHIAASLYDALERDNLFKNFNQKKFFYDKIGETRPFETLIFLNVDVIHHTKILFSEVDARDESEWEYIGLYEIEYDDQDVETITPLLDALSKLSYGKSASKIKITHPIKFYGNFLVAGGCKASAIFYENTSMKRRVDAFIKRSPLLTEWKQRYENLTK